MLPGVRRTWAPIGETPQLRCPLTYDHLSAISAVSQDGQLYLLIQEKAYDSAAVIDFLRQLLAEIPSKLLIIWDGATIHRSQAIQQFLRDGAAQRIQLERLPAYAPELNPDEGVWHYLKNVELPNVCCQDLVALSDKLETAADHLGEKPQIIQSFFRHCGY